MISIDRINCLSQTKTEMLNFRNDFFLHQWSICGPNSFNICHFQPVAPMQEGQKFRNMEAWLYSTWFYQLHNLCFTIKSQKWVILPPLNIPSRVEKPLFTFKTNLWLVSQICLFCVDRETIITKLGLHQLFVFLADNEALKVFLRQNWVVVEAQRLASLPHGLEVAGSTSTSHVKLTLICSISTRSIRLN